MPTPLAEGQRKFICSANDFSLASGQGGGQIKEISDFFASVMWRNLKTLHICHVEKFKFNPHVEKFQIFPHLSSTEIWNFFTWQIFFATGTTRGTRDKYQVWFLVRWSVSEWQGHLLSCSGQLKVKTFGNFRQIYLKHCGKFGEFDKTPKMYYRQAEQF